MPSSGRTNVTLEVLNPVASVQSGGLAISAHIGDLSGKRICLFRNSKRPAGPMLDAIKSSLAEKFTGLQFYSFLQEGHADLSKEEMSRITANADLVIAAVGD
jgi:hypothetical protein